MRLERKKFKGRDSTTQSITVSLSPWLSSLVELNKHVWGKRRKQLLQIINQPPITKRTNQRGPIIRILVYKSEMSVTVSFLINVITIPSNYQSQSQLYILTSSTLILFYVPPSFAVFVPVEYSLKIRDSNLTDL